MAELAMQRQGMKLIPLDDIAAENLSRIPNGKPVIVAIKASRNERLFRLLWVLASKVADACYHLLDREDAMDELKIRVRYVKYITNPMTGEVRIVPKSLSKLDGPGLSRLADRMIYVICSDIVPGLSEESLRAEIMAMIDGSHSNSSQPAASSDGAETDKLASELTAAPNAGTTSISSEGSPASDDGGRADADDKPGVGLPDGWQGIYVQAMMRVTDKPKSLATRRTEALRLIEGTPSDEDRAEMQAIDDLVRRRTSGGLSTDEFNAQLREILPTGAET